MKTSTRLKVETRRAQRRSNPYREPEAVRPPRRQWDTITSRRPEEDRHDPRTTEVPESGSDGEATVYAD